MFPNNCPRTKSRVFYKNKDPVTEKVKFKMPAIQAQRIRLTEQKTDPRGGNQSDARSAERDTEDIKNDPPPPSRLGTMEHAGRRTKRR